MRDMLDSHPDMRCGRESAIIRQIVLWRNEWLKDVSDSSNLFQESLDPAIGAFILEFLRIHNQGARLTCCRDAGLANFIDYLHRLFPNIKFIYMIRDGRAHAHSMVKRGYKYDNLTNKQDFSFFLSNWQSSVNSQYAQCKRAGPHSCMPVFYEQLVLHPEGTMRNVSSFLGIDFDPAVLSHEKQVGDKVEVSKQGWSSSQIIKPVNLEALDDWYGKIPVDVIAQMDIVAPMLRTLGYDPSDQRPYYGEPDDRVKKNSLLIKENSEQWKKFDKNYGPKVSNIQNSN